ncbi:MAG: glycosyltransferase family 4 protein, partial [Chloroflexi bacterium]|nr:glycosyltransferase family 4 protein [Chloroflexota bacterium]
MRVLYVLNAVGGGASLGIYEMLRTQPAIEAFAVVPGGNVDSIRPLFSDIRTIPLPTWNIPVEAGWERRAAMTLGQRRRGIGPTSSIQAIRDAIRAWNIDLVHTGTSLNRTGALAARMSGVPHIWHIKETIGHNNRVQFPLSDAKLIEYINHLSDRVVVMSEYIGAIFRQHNTPNLSVIPDGVELTPYVSEQSR